MSVKDYRERGQELADRHVDWLMDMLVPLIKLIAKEEFVHGYKHGLEDAEDTKLKPEN